MNKEAIILGGTALVGLNFLIKVWDVTYTDQAFWYVFVPLAVITGGAIKKVCS